jgi:hypothetical protein
MGRGDRRKVRWAADRQKKRKEREGRRAQERADQRAQKKKS